MHSLKNNKNGTFVLSGIIGAAHLQIPHFKMKILMINVRATQHIHFYAQ